MPTIEDLWTSTGACDRQVAEAALRRLYNALVFVGQPKEIIWTRSPEEFGVMWSHFSHLGQIPAFILNRSLRNYREMTHPNVFYDFIPDPYDIVGAYIAEGEGWFENFNDQNEEEQEKLTPVFVSDAIITQFSFPWKEGGCPLSSAVLDLVRQCAGVFVGLGVAVLCERPTFLDWDENGRSHGQNGPCMVFPSGWRAWGWHGRLVSEKLHRRIAENSLSASEVLELEDSILRNDLIQVRGEQSFARELGRGIVGVADNTFRRNLLKAYGVEQFVADFGRVQHVDDYGTLYRVPLPEDEDLVVVKVVNATPEADGTFRDYLIRVPPDIQEAGSAVEWSFDVEQDRYYIPMVQT